MRGGDEDVSHGGGGPRGEGGTRCRGVEARVDGSGGGGDVCDAAVGGDEGEEREEEGGGSHGEEDGTWGTG